MNPYDMSQEPIADAYRQPPEDNNDFADSANPLIGKKNSKHIQALLATLWLFIG